MASKDIVSSTNTHNVLTAGTVITGNITSDEDLRLDGTIEGNVSCKGKIIIGNQGLIQGDIACNNIEIIGTVVGDVSCNEKTILRLSSSLTGKIETQTIEIEPGAKFTGTCSMIAQ